LKQTIRQYLDSNNRDPKPFVWTKAADEILEKLGIFCRSLLTQQSRCYNATTAPDTRLALARAAPSSRPVTS